MDLYGSLWYIVRQKDKKYNLIKVYSDDICSFPMRGLPMLPWLMIAIAHGFPKPPRLRPVRRLGTALGRQRGPRRGGGEADLGGGQGGSDHRRRRLGSWGHGAIGMTTSVRSSAMLFAGKNHVIVVKLSSIIFSNDHNSHITRKENRCGQA